MNREQFKAQYQRVRRIQADADRKAQSLPCGADDALYERVGYLIEDICKEFPAIGVVLDSRYDSDPLETPLQWRYR